jgi:hypothetical protein
MFESQLGLLRYLTHIAGQNLAFAVLTIRNRTEAVVFQLENAVGMVKRLFDEPKAHWADAWQHNFISHHCPLPSERPSIDFGLLLRYSPRQSIRPGQS